MRIRGRLHRRFSMVGAPPPPIICRRDVEDMLVFIQAISKAPLQVHYYSEALPAPEHTHWHRLVKNIWWANQNIGGQKVVKSDKCMGVSQLLGHAPGLPPSLCLCGYCTGVSRRSATGNCE